MIIVHAARCLEYATLGHVERPERVSGTVARLRRDPHTWLEPQPCTEADLLRVHRAEMIAAVRAGQFHDADTPGFPAAGEMACLAAGGAILAAEQALASGGRAFSLMRPPGHHATPTRAMGFCYFNNLAVAVAKLLAEHPSQVRRVAILDFDCHHGNGTEEIFAGEPRVLFSSVHQSPCYPGTGLVSHDNCLNYPLPAEAGPELFLKALAQGLAQVAAFRPDLVAVSAGFDGYRGDPIASLGLEVPSFRQIGSALAGLCVPAFAVLEGGYAEALPECVAEFLAGWTP